MDESAENVNDDVVIIVENEAESLPAGEGRLKQQGTFGLMDTCPMCKLSFHNREPKLLPCLHSFCRRCLPAPFRSAEPRRDPHGAADGNKPSERSILYFAFYVFLIRAQSLKSCVTSLTPWGKKEKQLKFR